jgi:hypothetical protein
MKLLTKLQIYPLEKKIYISNALLNSRFPFKNLSISLDFICGDKSGDMEGLDRIRNEKHYGLREFLSPKIFWITQGKDPGLTTASIPANSLSLHFLHIMRRVAMASAGQAGYRYDEGQLNRIA